MMKIEGHIDLFSPEPSQDPTDDVHEPSDGHIEGPTRRNDTAAVDSILDSLSHHPIVQGIATVPDIRSDLFTYV
jgi:hypothetical protein